MIIWPTLDNKKYTI